MTDGPKTLPQMVIRGHLGLGDHIALNAVYRAYAAAHAVFIPAKSHNCVSIRFMLRDLPGVTVLPVADDAEADEFCRIAAKEGHSVLRLGMFGSPPYSPLTWDKDSYAQAHVPFEHRWSEWKCEREPERELPVPEGEYAFLHMDEYRGFRIDPKRVPRDMHLESPGTMPTTKNLFDFWGLIENATELHLIDSCFAIFADSLPKLKARRKVIHNYAKGAIPPSYKGKWEVLMK